MTATTNQNGYQPGQELGSEPGEARPDGETSRRRPRAGLRVRDDALWNPFEVIAHVLWIVFGFGFLLGRDHFVYVAELFLPVLLTGLAVLVIQALLRWRAGEPNVITVLRERLR